MDLKSSTRELLKKFNRSFPQFYEQFVSSEAQLQNLKLAYQIYKTQQAAIEIKPEGDKTCLHFAYRNQSFLLSDIFGVLAIYGVTIHSLSLYGQTSDPMLVFITLLVSRDRKPLSQKRAEKISQTIEAAIAGTLDVERILRARALLDPGGNYVETQFYVDPVFHLPTLLVEADNHLALFYRVMRAIWQEDLLVINANSIVWRGRIRLIFYLLGPNESSIPNYLGQKIADGVRQRLKR